jgi:hypothetical protein
VLFSKGIVLDIYDSDVASAIFLLLGLVVLFKNKISLTVSVGPSGADSFVNENSKYTKSKDIELKGAPKALVGIILVLAGVFFTYYFKGELLFSF